MEDILVNFSATITNALLTLVVIIAAVDRLGVDTTSLIALLGAAGIAVGLALKDSLGNFAAGIMLIVSRPFRTGDYVEVAGSAGSVTRTTWPMPNTSSSPCWQERNEYWKTIRH